MHAAGARETERRTISSSGRGTNRKFSVTLDPTADQPEASPRFLGRTGPGPLVEHFFRHESANLIAVLVRAFGLSRIELVEDMVQSAMLEAMQAWKQGGVPEKPAAWIHQVAKRKILDTLRRDRVHEKALAARSHSLAASVSRVDEWLEDDQLPDSLLRMAFVCCHPSLDRPSQIALTLKTLCGFGIAEIARGLLDSKEAVKKRIQRARRRLAEQNLSLELPGADKLEARLSTVHDVLYLLFNEGYSASRGHEPTREDLCEEAARLSHLLAKSALGSPTTKALLALMLFHAARLPARVDRKGAVVLLEEQDRTLWDRRMIAIADWWLYRSSPESDGPQELSRFHLEAAIARCHSVSPSVAETDWERIRKLYDRLLEAIDSPLYILNRAIARGQAGAPKAALAELEALRARPEFRDYFLLDCALARMHELAGHTPEALACYRGATASDLAPHERALVERKIARLRECDESRDG